MNEKWQDMIEVFEESTRQYEELKALSDFNSKSGIDLANKVGREAERLNKKFPEVSEWTKEDGKLIFKFTNYAQDNLQRTLEILSADEEKMVILVHGVSHYFSKQSGSWVFWKEGKHNTTETEDITHNGFKEKVKECFADLAEE